MILDTLNNAQRYRAVSANMATALDWMMTEQIDALKAPDVITIDDTKVFAQIQGYESVDPAEQRFESHRNYIDIQYVQSGNEVILWTPIETLSVTEEYDPDTDNMFYRDAPATELRLLPGYFAVFFPRDGHKPRCLLGAREPIGKIVVKVAVE
ncbi:MAG TPA: YhcH/YjgK/YiaL family protein [Alkalispirochaeta sp.]|nr:YhcH/YjgK/YiaL family protein [Alkalispirochaeta sp.]